MRSATTLPNALSFRYPRSKHLKLPLPIQLLPEGARRSMPICSSFIVGSPIQSSKVAEELFALSRYCSLDLAALSLHFLEGTNDGNKITSDIV